MPPKYSLLSPVPVIVSLHHPLTYTEFSKRIQSKHSALDWAKSINTFPCVHLIHFMYSFCASQNRFFFSFRLILEFIPKIHLHTQSWLVLFRMEPHVDGRRHVRIKINLSYEKAKTAPNSISGDAQLHALGRYFCRWQALPQLSSALVIWATPDHNFIATSHKVQLLVPVHWMFNPGINPGSHSSWDRRNCFNTKTRSAHFLCRKLNWWVVTLQILSPLCFRAFLKGHFLCRKFNHCDSLNTKEHIHEGEEDWMGTGVPAGARAASFQGKQISFTLMWLVKYFIVSSYVKFMFFMLCYDLKVKPLWGSWSLNVSTFHAKDVLPALSPTFYSFLQILRVPFLPSLTSAYLCW